MPNHKVTIPTYTSTVGDFSDAVEHATEVLEVEQISTQSDYINITVAGQTVKAVSRLDLERALSCLRTLIL